MPQRHGLRWLRILSLIVAIGFMANAGCAPLVVGGLVAAGGAAGYAYYNGEYKREFESGAVEVRHAARAVLTDKSMVVIEEHSDPNGGWLVSKTPNGDRVSFTFADFPDPQSPSGFVTRVGVRVSVLGDPDYSRRMLDEIGTRLGVAPLPPSNPVDGQPQNPATPTNRLVPRPGETAPPPLAENRPTSPTSGWGPPKTK